MIITPDILEALRQAVERYGSVSALEKISGVSNATIRNWISRKTKTGSSMTWNLIYPHIAEYLPEKAPGVDIPQDKESFRQRLISGVILMEGIDNDVKVMVLKLIRAMQ